MNGRPVTRVLMAVVAAVAAAGCDDDESGADAGTGTDAGRDTATVTDTARDTGVVDAPIEVVEDASPAPTDNILDTSPPRPDQAPAEAMDGSDAPLVVSPPAKLDLIFLIDNSVSMEQEQAN